MDRTTRIKTRTDALVLLAAVVGIAVVVNALAMKTSARVDLTANKVHTLSDASVEAARALEGVTIVAYVSDNLPETIPTGAGEMPLKGIDRAFRDKLEEYANASQGRIRLVYASTDSPNLGTVEEQAENARLEMISGGDAEVTGGRLEFRRYAIGATFHYKSVSEVFPKAVQPGFFEFEITKRLLRLEEKHKESKAMAGLLDAGKRIADGVKACADLVDSLSKGEEKPADAGLGLQSGGDDPGKATLARFEAQKDTLDKTCGSVAATVSAASSELGSDAEGNPFVAGLLESAETFGKVSLELGKYVRGEVTEGGAPADLAIPQLALVIEQLAAEVAQRHTNLEDSPGRKIVGFLCGHGEFCPFGDIDPIIPGPMQMMIQNNPMMKQIARGVEQIADSISQTNGRVGDGLFGSRGFLIRRVDAGKPIPEEISALVVYAPRKPLDAYDRYQLDQFLLSGRPVVVFAQQWDVSLLNLAPPPELGQDMRYDYSALERTDSNLAEVLAPYGVTLSNELVADAQQLDTVRVMVLENVGGLRLQRQREFPYPLVPVATDFDETHALSRSMRTISMPWATQVSASEALSSREGAEVVPIIRSGEESFAKEGGLPVIPPTLLDAARAEPATGPHPLALYVRAPLASAFKEDAIPAQPKGDDADKAGEGDNAADAVAKRKHRASGEARLLVVGSNLGIEGLTRETVLEGFDSSKLGEFNVEVMQGFAQWQANFQNWQLRIGQVSHLLGDNLRFLFNTMDWATSAEALVAIRSKGDTRLPMQEVDEAAAQRLRLGAIVGMPLLLVLLGLLRWQLRRRRAARLTTEPPRS
jgi:hypothetical protein